MKSVMVLDVTKWNHVEDKKEGAKHGTLRNSTSDLGGMGFKVSKMVHPDQNVFVQGRMDFHKIRRLLFLLYEQSDCQDNAILSLDAEMAFDRVEWQ